MFGKRQSNRSLYEELQADIAKLQAQARTSPRVAKSLRLKINYLQSLLTVLPVNAASERDELRS